MTWKTVLADVVFAYPGSLLMVTDPCLPFGKPHIPLSQSTWLGKRWIFPLNRVGQSITSPSNYDWFEWTHDPNKASKSQFQDVSWHSLKSHSLSIEVAKLIKSKHAAASGFFATILWTCPRKCCHKGKQNLERKSNKICGVIRVAAFSHE